MKRKYNIFVIPFISLFSLNVLGQDISLYQQFNGRYDFTFIGNTLNTGENNVQAVLEILDSSAAELSLLPGQTLEKAYLYWAGSGTGDFEVELNGEIIKAERTFGVSQIVFGSPRDFFAAFTDITDFVNENGYGTYTFSGLDLSAFLPQHFIGRTNFGGWAILLIYHDESLPLNQINVYDGLQIVPQVINISLSNLNVIDNDDAKIGFIAWEGDSQLSVNENLTINGNILSQLPLNPPNNAFNSTNSVTGSTTLYNMDLDIYDIQNFIQPGDTSAEIQLTSGADLVMINTVITKLNSQIPDAIITLNNYEIACGSLDLIINFTVTNLETATNPLPANTPIAFYADEVLVGQAQTLSDLAVGASESQTVFITLPATTPELFTLTLSVDDIGDGTGIVIEINEDNNRDEVLIVLPLLPKQRQLPTISNCNQGFGFAVFDFSEYYELLSQNGLFEVQFFNNEAAALEGNFPIIPFNSYTNETNPEAIFYKITHQSGCFIIGQFEIRVRNCPPTIYNWISANGDEKNDHFIIEGLENIFENFELLIYNRWGRLLWKGDKSNPRWSGEVTQSGKLFGNFVPSGTYYYVLNLNDSDYPEPYIGYVYITY
ncbi:MAG: gliding motility-associated C-terminal domain-containing protein [Flavobacterium sp.]